MGHSEYNLALIRNNPFINDAVGDGKLLATGMLSFFCFAQPGG